jgi:hypothetical protein
MKRAKADRIYWSVGRWSNEGPDDKHTWIERAIWNSRAVAYKDRADGENVRRVEGFFTRADA